MPPHLRIAALVFAAGLCPAFVEPCPAATEDLVPAKPAPIVKINPSVTWGVWEGWGTSLCWWAKIFGDRDDLADLLFTTKPVELDGNTLPGLGMTIARYNAGACSWNEIEGRRMVVSKTIHPFRQIESFWLDGQNPDPESPGWDWSVDAKQRAMLLKARDRGADRFELFSNSPPWWMCANDNPSGAAKDSVVNIRADQHGNFAHYLATIARRAKDHWGVAFTTVATFNEPTASFWYANGKQEGSYFDHATQAAILPLVRAELDRQGLADLPLSASDESYYDQAVATWKSFGPEIRAIVSQVNVHGYQGGEGRRDELHRIVSESGKRLWNSEYGDKNADGLSMARNLHLDMRLLRPTAWCYWQPLDGGNEGGWGFLGADLMKGVVGKPNPKLYVFAQYSRHIRPGMVVLDCDDEGTLVAHDAAARKLVIVTFNDRPKSRTLSYDLSRFSQARGRVVRWITEPEGSTRYEVRVDLVLKGKRLSCTLPPSSIQTLEIEGVVLAGTRPTTNATRPTRSMIGSATRPADRP